VAFEYRVKRDGERWQRNWEHAIFWTSLLTAVLWGLAFANIVRGVKINAHGDYTGTVLDLLNPYALLGGVVMLTLFTFHGAVFAALKTDGDIRHRARRLATVAGVVAAAFDTVFLGWTQSQSGNGRSALALAVALVALAAAIAANLRGREGWSFAF